MAEQDKSADPYLDPETGILRNLVGARTQAELDAAEADLVVQRQIELADSLVVPTFDLEHLKTIHRHLFQDVYDWAGQERAVDISKGGTRFLPPELFRYAVPSVFGELRSDRRLRSEDLETFVGRAAHHLDAVNHLHPFREGNGRTQRIFFDQVAERAGFRIAWSSVGRDRSIEAHRSGEDGLRAVLLEITAKKPSSRQDRLKRQVEAKAAELGHGDDEPDAEREI